MKLVAYHYIGLCLHNMNIHDIALKCFQKQLLLSWYLFTKFTRELKNIDMEFNSYENIGMEYFYMGNLNSAIYYHNKMIKGKKEPLDSNLRMLAHKFQLKYNKKLRKDKINDRQRSKFRLELPKEKQPTETLQTPKRPLIKFSKAIIKTQKTKRISNIFHNETRKIPKRPNSCECHIKIGM